MRSGLLPHLETFLEAAERGSFTAAAGALGLTQAAVSQRIHLLESALNTALFRRRASRVTLTEAGQTLHDYARRIHDLHVEARAQVTGIRSEVSGDLRLAASTIPGECLLPAMLGAFRGRYPKIRVTLSVSDSGDVQRQIAHGEAQLGFVGSQSCDPNLEFTPFATDSMVLVVPPDHPWRRRRQISIDELVQQPLVQREQGSGTRSCLEAALSAAGYGTAPLTVVFELGGNEAVKEAVSQGLGAAVLSRLAVARDVAAGRLHAIGVAGLTLVRELCVVRDRRRALPGPAQLLLSSLPSLSQANLTS